MLNDKLIAAIPDYFDNQLVLSKDELSAAIGEDFPDWSEATINVRISELKKKNIIQNPSRGLYTARQKARYVPQISPQLKKLYNTMSEHLPYAQYCVWDTLWLNEFMLHQPFHYYLVAEVEKTVEESAFHKLSETYTEIFLNPDTELFEHYIFKAENPVIIKHMVSESPTSTIDMVIVPEIEKLLVDMLADKELFGAQQNEIEFIYRTVHDKYSLNQKMMKRYARRRNREKELEKLWPYNFGKK